MIKRSIPGYGRHSECTNQPDGTQKWNAEFGEQLTQGGEYVGGLSLAVSCWGKFGVNGGLGGQGEAAAKGGARAFTGQ